MMNDNDNAANKEILLSTVITCNCKDKLQICDKRSTEYFRTSRSALFLLSVSSENGKNSFCACQRHCIKVIFKMNPFKNQCILFKVMFISNIIHFISVVSIKSIISFIQFISCAAVYCTGLVSTETIYVYTSDECVQKPCVYGAVLAQSQYRRAIVWCCAIAMTMTATATTTTIIVVLSNMQNVRLSFVKNH